ncbi:hypothetical protein CDL12_15274 [Handroanthus impetiginosus]|uniref:Uncharacterized protein n=1 Tax=Handroanthus impetiginosus TaxID=429701 RepID=A0A2G9H3N7_9LAMI|nr:hypothetical protein CDL12_15274 [Handroanthus impetiginosus]
MFNCPFLHGCSANGSAVRTETQRQGNYLRSLWHQGPPKAPASSAPARASRRHLQPTKGTQFKKNKKRRQRRGKKSTTKPNNAVLESNSSPGAEWPIPSPPPPPSTTGWPSLVEKPDPKLLPLSPEEQSKLAAKHAHQRALKVVHGFFRSSNGDDSDAIDSSSDEDDELMEEDNGGEKYSFFFKLFKEDTELREYYEKNLAKGEFNCLVCGAAGGKNTGKKFKGCLALVQHSITIAKTKKRKAHKVFGKAVCEVLGWDIDRLSSVVSLLSDNSGKTEGNVDSDNKESLMTFVDKVDSVEGNHGEAVPESGSIVTGRLPHGDEGDMNSLMHVGAVKNLENLGTRHPHKMEEPAAEVLPSVSVDRNLENLGIVHPHNMEKPAAEASTSVNVDRNLENLEMLHPLNVEPAADTLTSVSVDKNLENLGSRGA